MNGKQSQLDLLTQQFIVSRWNTPTGREVRDAIIASLKAGKEIRDILSDYVLKHPLNIEPQEFPYYPPEAIEKQEFWVLANDDLRGIHFYEENFSGTTAFAKTTLVYSVFSKCNLSNVDFEYTDLCCAQFDGCDFSNTVFANVSAVNSSFINSNLHNSSFLNSHFINTDFSSSDLRGVYFENCKLRQLKVNYITKFDTTLQCCWHQRSMPREQLPDLYRSIRVGYERVELLSYADFYLMKERVANRKYVLWPALREKKSIQKTYSWGKDLLWSVMAGYGTKPLRTMILGAVISLLYTFIYYFAGTPMEVSGDQSSFISALYFSFTTFATLGYGDITYAEERYFMRLLSTSEAWLGAVFIALFVVVIARKIIRR